MKSWEELTKAEKEKLDMYVKIMTLWQPIYIVITLSCLIGLIVAIPLMFTMYTPLIFAGFFIIILVGYFFLFMVVLINRDNKKLYLMFGVESLSKDIFDISKEDVNKVKRVFKKVK